MPFPALIPLLTKALPYIIKGGAAIGSSLLGSKATKSKPSVLEQTQIDRANRIADRGEALSGNLFDMGMPAVRQPMDYWASILSGDRSRMTSALGPELSRIGEGYRTAGQTSAALNPRGGPTPDFLANQPFSQQRDVSTMFQQQRPGAATALQGAGSNLLANSIQSLYGATQTGRDILNYEAERRKRDREAGANIGKTIFDILSGSGGLSGALGNIFGGGGSTAGLRIPDLNSISLPRPGMSPPSLRLPSSLPPSLGWGG